MSRFFQLNHALNVFTNLDQVRELRCGRETTTVIFADGEEEQYSGRVHGVELLASCAPIVPAAPGFQLLVYALDCFDEPDADPTVSEILALTNRVPIVAWRIDYGVFAEPVTVPHVEQDHKQITATLLHDGRVVEPEHNDDGWQSVEAWAEHVIREWRNWIKKQSAPRVVSTSR